MRVAICDDEVTALEFLRSLLKNQEEISLIRGYHYFNELKAAIEDGDYFDIVFMDIDLQQSTNGIDCASELSKICPCTQIIYVTGFNDHYSQQIFLQHSSLCGYLVKPVNPQLLEAMVKKASENIKNIEEQKLLIQQKGIVHAIPFRMIYYLESRGHQLFIHTVQENILCYERIVDLKEHLPRNFFQCHKSYVINFDYIKRIDKNHIGLKTGEELPISKTNYTETRSAYFQYMGEIQ